MSKALSYINENGFTVFTSYYLKLKGGCCKCSCLHCPYGYTLEKHGLGFEKLNLSKSKKHLPLIRDLLESADLHPQKDLIHVIFLKNYVCGLLTIKDSNIDKIILRKHFSDQNLCREIISTRFLQLNSADQTKKHK